MKCPACGFDSPDGAQWCDLCKEPFNKRRPASAEPASAGPAEPSRPAAALSPEVLAKLTAAKTAGPSEAGRPGIPKEFQHLDVGAELPKLPPWFRAFAWGLLGIWVIWGMIVAGIYYAKKRAMDESASSAPAQPAEEAPITQSIEVPLTPPAP